jgi:hypothetical protein
LQSLHIRSHPQDLESISRDISRTIAEEGPTVEYQYFNRKVKNIEVKASAVKMDEIKSTISPGLKDLGSDNSQKIFKYTEIRFLNKKIN